MKIIVTENFAETCAVAGKLFVDVIRQKPDACLGLATGSSAQGVYPHIIEANRKGEIDCSALSSINLDEYVGLAPDHPQSYRYFMNQNLFDHINIDKANTYVASGVGDPDENLRAFRAALAAKPIDIQLLGIGVDGHIGFNEPGEAFHNKAYIETLDASTIHANSRFFDSEDEVPRQAYTMGVGDILRAKKLVLVINDLSKAVAVRGLIDNDLVYPSNQATAIKLHADATVIMDRHIAQRVGYQEKE